MTYREFCDLKSNDPKENMFPKGTSAEEAMDILNDTFRFSNGGFFKEDLYILNIIERIILVSLIPISIFRWTILVIILSAIELWIILCKSKLEKRSYNYAYNYRNTINNKVTPRKYIDILNRELLPKDWYVAYPASDDQSITEIVAYILYLYNNPDSKRRFINKLKCVFA